MFLSLSLDQWVFSRAISDFTFQYYNTLTLLSWFEKFYAFCWLSLCYQFFSHQLHKTYDMSLHFQCYFSNTDLTVKNYFQNFKIQSIVHQLPRSVWLDKQSLCSLLNINATQDATELIDN